MREILFKAKVIDTGEWIEGIPIKTHIGLFMCFDENPHYCNQYGYMEIDKIIKVDENTLCQYTGLTDKNGKKIWENDIVKQSFYKFLENEIESEEISGCEIGVVAIIPTKGTCMKNPLQYVEVNGEIEKNFEKTKMYKGVCQYRCEVIGNIFDNPELLEVGA